MKWCNLKWHSKSKEQAGSRKVPNIPFAAQAVFSSPDLTDWYHPVIIGPQTVGEMAMSSACLQQAIHVYERLEPDDYVSFLLAYYRAGLERFGDNWHYADIVTVLIAAAKLLHPSNYLEIGVRRGRSMAMVATICPDCDIVGFDLWAPDYAGMSSPGPDFVRAEIKKLGHSGRMELISGDSHKTLPRFFSKHHDAFFDLIIVDGDHSKKGAERDLRDVLPRLKVGGIIIFDDICHPLHPYLAKVWQRVVASDSRFAAWQFNELGYGVAFAIRKDI